MFVLSHLVLTIMFVNSHFFSSFHLSPTLKTPPFSFIFLHHIHNVNPTHPAPHRSAGKQEAKAAGDKIDFARAVGEKKG